MENSILKNILIENIIIEDMPAKLKVRRAQ